MNKIKAIILATMITNITSAPIALNAMVQQNQRQVIINQQGANVSRSWFGAVGDVFKKTGETIGAATNVVGLTLSRVKTGCGYAANTVIVPTKFIYDWGFKNPTLMAYNGTKGMAINSFHVLKHALYAGNDFAKTLFGIATIIAAIYGIDCALSFISYYTGIPSNILKVYKFGSFFEKTNQIATVSIETIKSLPVIIENFEKTYKLGKHALDLGIKSTEALKDLLQKSKETMETAKKVVDPSFKTKIYEAIKRVTNLEKQDLGILAGIGAFLTVPRFFLR